MTLLWAALAGLAQAAAGPPPVNPGRPSVTNGASLTPPGYFQLESGVADALGGTGSDFAAGESFALKLTDRPGRGEYRVGSTGYLVQRATGGPNLQGFGDMTLGYQRLLQAQSNRTCDLAALFQVKAPTARVGLGTGRPDASFDAIGSKDLTDRLHLDVNLGAAILGVPGRNSFVRQGSASFAFAYKVSARTNLQAELFGASGDRLGGSILGHGYGLAYAARPDSVFDAYVAFGLTAATPRVSFTVGYTCFVGRAF